MKSTLKDQLPGEWKFVEREEALTEAWKLSHEKPVFLFKHSTRCGISHQAMGELAEWHSTKPDKVAIFFLDLITYRPLSNLISEKSKVPHQSPQLICLVNGEAVNAISHTSIEKTHIDRFYNKVLPLTESHE